MRVQHLLTAATAALTFKKNLVPDFEVKALLNATAVLGPDHKLSHSVLTAFDLGTDIKHMHIQFLDTDDAELYEHGWSPRIRRTDDEDEDDFELTYKRRYPIERYEAGIDDALALANSEGFDASDADAWAAQVEWGYTKLTLSITRKKRAAGTGYHGIELPSVEDARKMLIKHAPSKFKHWVGHGGQKHWGTRNLEAARIYGPIATQRSTGEWDGVRVHVEVWPIKAEGDGEGIEYLVEASFKVDEREDASERHDRFIELLSEKGWFLPKDSLKSRMIMDRY